MGRVRKEIDETTKQGIIDDYKNGVRTPEIKAKYKIKDVAFYRLLKESGVPRRPNGPPKGTKDKRNEERNQKIVKLYGEGFNTAQIGVIHRLTREGVSKILESAGVKVHQGTPKEIKAAMVVDAPTHTIGELVQKYDVSAGVVRKTLRDNNVKAHPKRASDQQRAISEAYVEGLSMAEIMERFSLTGSRQIHSACAATGTQRRETGQRSPSTMQKIRGGK